MVSEPTMAETTLRARARRAYELARLRTALSRAGLLVLLVATAMAWLLGPGGYALLAWTFAAWVFLLWRGGALLRGGRYGLAAGAITLLLPLSLLRPCCRPGAMPTMSGECCTMPGVCLLVGAALGLSLAWFVPRGPGARRLETAGGMALGMASIAALKCHGLFLGEAIGLLGGMLGGVAAVSLAGLVLDRRRAAV